MEKDPTLRSPLPPVGEPQTNADMSQPEEPDDPEDAHLGRCWHDTHSTNPGAANGGVVGSTEGVDRGHVDARFSKYKETPLWGGTGETGEPSLVVVFRFRRPPREVMIPAEGEDMDTLLDLLMSSPVSTHRDKGELVFPALETVHEGTTALWNRLKPSMLIPESFYLTWHPRSLTKPRGAPPAPISTTSETRSANLEYMTPENSDNISIPMIVTEDIQGNIQGGHVETHAWSGVEVDDPMEGLSVVQTHNPSGTTSPPTPQGLISSATKNLEEGGQRAVVRSLQAAPPSDTQPYIDDIVLWATSHPLNELH